MSSQCEDCNTEDIFDKSGDQTSQLCLKRRQRSYNATGIDIVPYAKRPKMIHSEILPLYDTRKKLTPNSVRRAKETDFLWMIDHFLSPNPRPMWIGWNSDLLP